MNKKIIGIFIYILLMVIIIPVTANIKEISTSDNIDNITNSMMNDRWIKTFNKGRWDSGLSVQQTIDGGYIIVGITENTPGTNDFWLIKTDSNGNKIWDKTYGGEGIDFGNFVQQTSDGGYIITGYTTSYGNDKGDVWLIKTGADGNILWNKTFGYSLHDSGSEVWQTSDGGFIIIGDTNTDGGGSGDIWVIKTDSNGDMIWDKTFNGDGRPSHDYGTSIGITSDSGYILLGVTFTTSNNYSIWLIKIDEYGNKIWDKTIGGTDDEFGWSVQQTNDGGYIITGVDNYGITNGISTDKLWLIKTDTTGNIVWDRTYFEIGSTRGYSVKQTSDDGYIIVGEKILGSRYKPILIKTDNKGNKEWCKTFGRVLNGVIFSVQQTTDGGYIMTGSIGRFCSDLWLIKTDSQGKLKTLFSENMYFEKLFQRFPFFERILNLII
ncbi:MAG: hypothetical protein BV457_05925 [Thermoplasmata archaeon M9B1D]|nr:MAG: hypothetical protein BV457_05925 [Thermoplasmata archaeon M9B1D]